MTVLAGSAGKVHLEALVERFDPSGRCYRSGRVLYILTNHEGRRGMRFRAAIPQQTS